MARARGGDRTDRRRRYRVPAGPVLAGLAVAGLAIGFTGGARSSAAGGSSPAHRTGPSGPALTLLGPPTVAGPGSPFAVRLGVPAVAGRAALTLRVTVYAALHTPTEFDETLGGSPVGSVQATSGPLALSSLTPDTVDQQRGVDLSMPVSAGGVAGAGTGPFTISLHCPNGACDGVYPVRLELSDAASGTATRILTYLVYTDPSGDIEPLRFALVIPLDLASSSSSSGAPSVSASSLATLEAVVGAVSATRSAVPLTLAPGPATVAALSGDRGERAQATLSSVVAAASQTGRETLCGSFVSVNASALAGAGSGGSTELSVQVRRGAQALDAVPGLRAACTADSAWVADDTLDPAALAGLAGLGYHDIVVPPGAVAGPPLATTPTRRFTFVGGPPAGSAILSDPELSSRLQSTSRTDPALAADQLLAELEFYYSEAPNTPEARGVVAAVASGGRVNPTVVADVLDGLQNNPMVEPVTLATLFSDVPVGGTVGRFTEPSPRRPASVGAAAGLPVRAIAAARAQWAGLAAAVSASPAGNAVAMGLGDLLLESEDEQLTPSQQRAGIRRFDDAFDHELALLSITSREVRLTASTGSVPITVIKSAPYPVEAVLTVTSDKIAFSTGNTQVPNTECATPIVTTVAGKSSVSTQCTFIHGTNAVYIEMRSRVSGDFRMSVTLNSPQGGLQLASGLLTVRSMSTSAVAIGLSIAAGAVLLGWWGRTMWRNPRTRRGLHRRRGRGR
jgi:hypothetical protein